MKRLLFVFTILLVVGCSNMETNKETVLLELDDHKTEIITINEQQFELIPYFNVYESFVNQEYTSSTKQRQAYVDIVIKPISEQLNYPSRYFEQDTHFIVTEELLVLRSILSELNIKYPIIKETIVEALTEATDVLKGGDYKVYILPFPDEPYSNEYMRGVGGFSMGSSGTIVLFIDPYTYPEASLKAIAVHEYHHSALLSHESYQNRLLTLLDKVLIEGKAEAFTRTIYPDYTPKYLQMNPLTKELQANVWEYIHLNGMKSFKIEDLNPLFLGDTQKGFPMHSNYKMGAIIMDAYINKYPEIDVETWTLMDSLKIVDDLDVDSWYD